MKKVVEKSFINIAIVAVFLLILLGASLSFYNKQLMRRALVVKEQSDMVMRETENTFLNIRNMDISSRGYAIMQEDRFLFYPVETAREMNRKNFYTLDSLFALQGYSDPQNYAKVKQGFDAYVNMYEQMVNLLLEGRVDDYKALLAKDFGKQFWTTNEVFSTKLYAYEEELYKEAQAAYEAAVFRDTLIYVLLLLIGLPTLAVIFFTLRKEARQRRSLLLNLKANNEKYLFNEGKTAEEPDAKQILDNSIKNLQQASHFVNQISEGNYEVRWEEMDEQNASLNQDNLAGRLILMREQMQKVKEEDRRRLWVTEGLSHFSGIIRNHQQELEQLSFHGLQFMVKYLNIQQGSLFILEEEGEQPYLRLAACYAFDRKKYVDKRVEIGQGLLGQTYLEAETVMLTEIPQDYLSITSGLGDARPACLLIVPMKYNEKVQALVELASFRQLEPYQVSFVEKAGEFIASAIATAINNENTQQLLRQLQANTEQLRAQEEELRQNMEELEATQEQMSRKEKDLEQQLKKVSQERA